MYDRNPHPFSWRDIERILDSLPRDEETSGEKLWNLFQKFCQALLPGVAWQIIEAAKPVIMAWLDRGGPAPGEPGNPA